MGSLRRRLARAAFFGLVATGLMAPLASHWFVPNLTDLPAHIAASWQARLALDEGQFPLRVAPGERGGRRYAMPQLYGQLPYTASALIQKYLLPDREPAPYVALKAVVWLSLVLGGVYLHLLARYLGARDAAAMVAAVAYMASPYLLVNLHARGAVLEAVAQGLLPAALYQLLRFVAGGGQLRFCKATVAVTAVLLTHLITFAYSLAAAGALVLVLSRARVVRRLGRGAAVALGTLVLAAYFLAPILALRGALDITTGSRLAMRAYRWVTPLPGLLSPASVPPVPTGAMNLPASIHPAVGLVALTGALLAAAVWLRLLSAPPAPPLRRFGPALLLVFAAGFAIAWSPVDVWTHLPDLFSLAQFPYRQITLTMWSGALLLALALSALLPRGYDALAGAVGCLVVLTASGSYLTSAPPWHEADAFELVRRPSYREAEKAPYALQLDGPLLARAETLVDLSPGGTPLELAAALVARARTTPARLHVGGRLPAPLAASGLDVTLVGDGVTLATVRLAGAFPWASVPFAAPPPDRAVSSLEWRDVSPAGPVAPADLAGLRAVLAPADWPLDRVYAPPESGAGYAPVDGFERRGDSFTVRVTAGAPALVLLPLEYYPSLLDVRLDGVRVPYAPYATPWGQVLTAVRVPAGAHAVRARFAGHRVGNAVSLAGWLALAALAAGPTVSRWRRRAAA